MSIKQEKQINNIIVRIEIAYRKKYPSFINKRIKCINKEKMRLIMKENRIGLQCKKCLNKSTNKHYCCKKHSKYYNKLFFLLLGIQEPFGEKKECALCKKITDEKLNSPDHIIPITKGGLEFDRNNIQWTHLICNLKKGNRDGITPKPAEQKKEIDKKQRLIT